MLCRLSLLLVCLAAFTSAQRVAHCLLKGTSADPTISGYITFTQNVTNGNVDVFVNATGITTNLNAEHGLHVHMWGDVSSNDALATGGHWMTPGEVHACPPDANRHKGAMGNWMVDAGGSLVQHKSLDKLSLSGNYSIIGRSVVLHSQIDDCVTQPNGNAGSRIAQCIIGKVNEDASNDMAPNQGVADVAMCVIAPVPGAVPNSLGGYAVMRQTPEQLTPTITVMITGVNGGVHGIHTHQFGDLTTGLTVGGHWNPTGVMHGMPNFPRHWGGMGNAYYTVPGNDTILYFRFDTNDVLTPIPVLGRGFVVHANRDNCSDPIGFSGGRLGYCAWGLGNPANFANGIDFSHFNTVIPASVPVGLDPQSISDCEAVYPPTSASTVEDSSAPLSFVPPMFCVVVLAFLSLAV